MGPSSTNLPFITYESLGLPAMQPHPALKSGWAQTIASAILPTGAPLLKLKRHAIPLDDGGSTIMSEVLETAQARLLENARVCLLVHGLAGSEDSPYILRLANLLLQNGYRPFLMNLRGCGPGKGLSKSLYHSGRSDDTRRAIKIISSLFPKAALTQIGFSLGGNITLKMAGEEGSSPVGNLDSCIAVSAPLDLGSSVEKMGRRENLFFDQFFVQMLRIEVFKRHRQFPDLPQARLPLILTLKGFDDIYTAPQSGFKDGTDYYNQCSSLAFIPSIKIPCLMVVATDDPIIETRFYHTLKPQKNLSVLITEKGGHVGYLTRSGRSRFPEAWHDQAILRWLQKL
ncbi:MAG: alpha/beta fold hydrolase [Bdellovibrionales bacterium]|nr:alpha/beta fold hydrolase [Bdellovibrionales bacterium]